MIADAQRLQQILERTVGQTPGVPGVVAMLTDRDGIRFVGAAGSRDGAAPMSDDAVFALFSTTKAVTATAVLQCVEDGLLDLDRPAADYVPDIGTLHVLTGFAADGAPQFRSPTRPITTRMLLLHTAGFAYAFCNALYHKLAVEHGQANPIDGVRAGLMTPLIFDPGHDWEYGTNMDWAGLVVEAVRGKRLREVFADRIFSPLGMTETAFTPTAEMASRLAVIHQRLPDGNLMPLPDLRLPAEPEVDMGGHGLYGTIGDYMRFIRMWLNDGDAPGGRILHADTVALAARGGLAPHQQVKKLPSVNPALTNEGEFFPGLPKNWGLSFLINDEAAPTGRRPGSLAWAGLANTYFWIDRAAGIGGYWATQILPFADPQSFGGYMAFETACYAKADAG